ncbi:anti-sigma-28 factor, FlgM [Planococcus donghaensis MPA1U2]|uniref:Negative regulator of flagellin synthesis n=2 Tax=Planococcus donghaensis TaxID=414778 RepID=E7RIZ7_9BACL|nr:flagellar biosynthesis anti-sigma factor FlgM [Planococcus donghaensis]ANU24598.1 flagellar biosynthesis anti-sigma factor FlgM [Planococcus donghaensis]EGA89007.1 anti-sigma-28 factor, FlgM [Planococcus donghaensis MPA1U2]
MNIDKTNSSSFIQSYQKMQVTPAAKTKPLQKEDELQISNEAKAMFEKNASVDVERQEKIEFLKAQVASGEYKVDAGKVADKVHQFWFDK